LSILETNNSENDKNKVTVKKEFDKFMKKLFPKIMQDSINQSLEKHSLGNQLSSHLKK
tara:strand:+ start:1431 stop:1604 length:174 start_codon:yes stop_codon:yes gene_type:complete